MWWGATGHDGAARSAVGHSGARSATVGHNSTMCHLGVWGHLGTAECLPAQRQARNGALHMRVHGGGGRDTHRWRAHACTYMCMHGVDIQGPPALSGTRGGVGGCCRAGGGGEQALQRKGKGGFGGAVALRCVTPRHAQRAVAASGGAAAAGSFCPHLHPWGGLGGMALGGEGGGVPVLTPSLRGVWLFWGC